MSSKTHLGALAERLIEVDKLGLGETAEEQEINHEKFMTAAWNYVNALAEAKRLANE